MTLPSVIAIDGPAASGKTAVGKELAQRLGYRFIDTGLMYRACTYLALRSGVSMDDETALTELAASVRMVLVPSAQGNRLLVDDEDVTDHLRTPEVDGSVSSVARVRGVRIAMIAAQRRMAEEGQVVMVGRDIGSGVLPYAAKVYLNASSQERVRRRLAEIEAGGARVTADEVRDNLEMRDRMDTERADGPLLAAADAVRVETDGLAVHEVTDHVLELLGSGS